MDAFLYSGFSLVTFVVVFSACIARHHVAVQIVVGFSLFKHTVGER